MPDALVSYGEDELQVVDVWLPKSAGPFRTVLMVHGGCWTTDIARRDLMNWIAADLRDAAYAVWNIEYRGVDRPGGGFPGTFADVASAADALATNAARFNLDARRVVALGHSAGGHLALWIAGRHNIPVQSAVYRPRPIAIAQVISLGGLPDLEAAAADPDQGCGNEVIARLVGVPALARPDVYGDTSVPRLLPLGVPQDLVNGAADMIIPVHFASDYAEQARKVGDTVTEHYVSHAGHVELICPETAAWAKAKSLLSGVFSGG